MDNYIIAAIPVIDEHVHKVSSEKLAHMTMLYLHGDVVRDNYEEIASHIAHVGALHHSFYMTRKSRGILGDDGADVIFYEESQYAEAIRHDLLMNSKVRLAYDSVEQYPEWIPHLTLGYPERPAKDDAVDYPVYHSYFDRLLLTSGEEYDGPIFELNGENRPESDGMAMHSEAAVKSVPDYSDKSLSHYGVKGMKWGVRKDRGHEGEVVKTKQLKKLDKKWAKQNEGVGGYVKANNAMADRMNGGLIDKFNQDPRWKDVDLSKNPKLESTYMDEYFSLVNKVMNEEMLKLGSNPSGSKRYVLETDDDGNEYAVLQDVRSAKHAEGDTQSAFLIKKKATGHIARLESVERELKHYGVKGMKWGVRKDDTASSGPQPVTVKQKKPGSFAKAEGGAKHPATKEAEGALALRQKAKRSTTDSLTNEELQTAIRRMQLEVQFNQLEQQSDRRNAGARFVAGLFGESRYGQKKPKPYADPNEQAGEMVSKAFSEYIKKSK